MPFTLPLQTYTYDIRPLRDDVVLDTSAIVTSDMSQVGGSMVKPSGSLLPTAENSIAGSNIHSYEVGQLGLRAKLGGAGS